MSASLGGGADLYAVLGVDRHADDAAINASYRRLAKLKHPDKNRTNPQATAEFQDLNKAYSVLRDARLRRDYDQRHPPPRPRGARGPPTTPPAEPAGVHPQSAARAAAATAAENAKTPAQRRAEADAALQANAARHHHHGSSGRRRAPFRFVRVPTTWDGAPDGGPGADGDDAALFGADDPACKALQDAINALRRAMQQRDAADAALHRQQKQLALQMDAAWAAVGQHSAALRRLDAQRAERQAATDWFEGLFGAGQGVVREGAAPPGPDADDAADVDADDADTLEAERLRADLGRAQRALAAGRAKVHAVVAQLAASAAQRQDQDAQLKALAARYRAAAFQSGGGAAAAAPPPPNDDDAHFDGWVAWEAPEAGAGRGADNLWQDDDDDGGGGGGGLWDSDSEAGTEARGHGGDGDDSGDPWAPDTDPQRRQWFPFRATAAEWVPEQQAAGATVNMAPATAVYSDGGTNVWEDVSSEERFNADLLHIESDEERPVGVEGGGEDEGEEGEGESSEDEEDDESEGEEGEEEEGEEEEGEEDDEDGDDEEDDEEDEDEEAEEDIDDDNDAAAAWFLDENLCEAYTERLKLDDDSWHAEICREW